LFSPNHRPLSPKDRRTVNAVFALLYRLANLDTGGAFHSTDLNYLFDTEIVAPGESPVEPAKVFRRYRSEWLSLLAAGAKRGWPWVDGFAPRGEAA